jgi:hypothetical protein
VFPWWQNKKVEVYMLYNLRPEDRKFMESEIRQRLTQAVGQEYAERIMMCEIDAESHQTVTDYIIDDICLSSYYEEYHGYSCDDMQMAIGRAICKCIGTDY